MRFFRVHHNKHGRFATLWSNIKHAFNVFWFWIKIATGAATFVVAAYLYGSGQFINTVYAENVTPIVAPKQVQADIMLRIFDCESGKRDENGRAIKGSRSHIDKNGQVLMRANTNGTIDIGIGQINEYYWGKVATKLGLNLTIEEDNIKMANWIYENYGVEPWKASRSCWN